MASIAGQTVSYIGPLHGYDVSRPRFAAVLGIWLLVSLILLVVAAPAILTMRFPDPDDMMRLQQVRDWLGGQSWYDVTQYRMNQPDGAPMHWSRLVDLPIGLIIFVLTPLMGSTQAELIAMVIIPLLTLLLAMWLVARLTARMAGAYSSSAATNTQLGRDAAYLACVVMVMLVPVVHQLRPLRIDHHGWQIVLALVALDGLLSRNRDRGAVQMGGALAIWLSISMEGLPLAAAFMGCLALLWLCDIRYRQSLVLAMATLTSVSAALFMATRMFAGDAMLNWCDALSPVHIGTFGMDTAMLGLLALLNPKHRLALLAGFGFTASAALALLYSGAPHCATGAMADIDPLVRDYWYARVPEGLPLWRHTSATIAQNMAVPVLALVALLLRWIRLGRHRTGSFLLRCTAFLQTRHGKAAIIIIAATAMALWVERAAAVAALIALPVAAPMLMRMLRRIRALPSPPARIIGTLAIFVLVTPGLIIAPASALIGQSVSETPPVPQDAAQQDIVSGECTRFDALDALADLPRGNIMAPLNIGPRILLASKHSVVASGHHRNDAGIRDVLQFFTGQAGAAKAIASNRRVDYIAYCEGSSEVMLYAQESDEGVMAQLEAGQAPDWVEPIALYEDTGLRIWRVQR